MAFVFRIVSTTNAALTYITVPIMNEDTWSPVTAQTNDPITESVPFVLIAASDDDMAAQVREINRMIDDTRYYLSSGASSSLHRVWWDWAMEGESAEHLSRLVYTIDVAFENGLWFECDGHYAQKIRGVLTLVVAGWWEALHDSASGAFNAITPICVLDDFAALGGDAPALMSRFVVTGMVHSAIYTTAQMWLGWRTQRRHGDLDDFVFLWELEDGTAATDTAAAIEAGGSPNDAANNCMETTFATDATLIRRARIRLDDVTANTTENLGQFLVLLRVKADFGTSCTVRVDYTLDEYNPFAAQRVLVTGTLLTVDATVATGWKTIDTGLIVNFPPGNPRALVFTGYESYGFDIWASRVVGAGSLYIDALIMIPVDEYFVHHNPGDVGTATANFLAVGPDDGTGAFLLSTAAPGDIYDVTPPDITGAGVPYPSPRAYLVAVNSLDFNTLGSVMGGQFILIPRYHSMHGAG